MTPARMAAIHAACFTSPRPWSEGEFRDLIGDALILRALHGTQGFALARAVAGEAELLTIAVEPDCRRGGIGGQLLAQVTEQSRTKGAQVMFLEVAEGNAPAIALYTRAGFHLAGRRPRYYDDRIDALIYRMVL
jgi:[ribosomal protein S18]-alanine N-acetyltransferase